jgi:hypothetical protein
MISRFQFPPTTRHRCTRDLGVRLLFLEDMRPPCLPQCGPPATQLLPTRPHPPDHPFPRLPTVTLPSWPLHNPNPSLLLPHTPIHSSSKTQPSSTTHLKDPHPPLHHPSKGSRDSPKWYARYELIYDAWNLRGMPMFFWSDTATRSAGRAVPRRGRDVLQYAEPDTETSHDCPPEQTDPAPQTHGLWKERPEDQLETSSDGG